MEAACDYGLSPLPEALGSYLMEFFVGGGEHVHTAPYNPLVTEH